MRTSSRVSDDIQYEGGGRTASFYDYLVGSLEQGGGLKGSRDRYPKGKNKSKAYPMVSSSNFAGGGRSYPIPTRADAVDALRLAGMHGRSDVRSKVYAKYPDLKKQEGGKISEEEYLQAKERYFNALTQEGKQFPVDTEGKRKDHAVMQQNMSTYEPGGRWTTVPLVDAAYQTGNTLRSWFNQAAGTHYQRGGSLSRGRTYNIGGFNYGRVTSPMSNPEIPIKNPVNENRDLDTKSRETGSRNMLLHGKNKCGGPLMYKCGGGRLRKHN